MVTAVRWLLANPLTLYSHFRTPLGFHMYFVACASPIYRHSAALHSENIHSGVTRITRSNLSILSLSRLIVLCFKVQRKHALLI